MKPSTLFIVVSTAAIITLGIFGAQRMLMAPTVNKQTVQLYFYNQQQDMDQDGNILCSRQGLIPVSRTLSYTTNLIFETLQLLLKGNITEEERNQDITTEFPLEDVILKNISLQDGILTLFFDDPLNKTSGGSCRIYILRSQIEETAKQFSEVREVRFVPEETFQP